MAHQEPERITPQLIDELQQISAYDPDHLPAELALINVFRERHPSLVQIACFDTAFHQTMPRVAQLLPIPGGRRPGHPAIWFSWYFIRLSAGRAKLDCRT